MTKTLDALVAWGRALEYASMAEVRAIDDGKQVPQRPRASARVAAKDLLPRSVCRPTPRRWTCSLIRSINPTSTANLLGQCVKSRK